MRASEPSLSFSAPTLNTMFTRNERANDPTLNFNTLASRGDLEVQVGKIEPVNKLLNIDGIFWD